MTDVVSSVLMLVAVAAYVLFLVGIGRYLRRLDPPPWYLYDRPLPSYPKDPEPPKVPDYVPDDFAGFGWGKSHG